MDHSKKVFLFLGGKLKRLIFYICGFFRYFVDLFCFIKRNTGAIKIKGLFPMIVDRYDNAGGIDKHYFLQDIYVSNKIISEGPAKHYDIGSRVDGFIGHLLAGMSGKVIMMDIRPFPIKVNKLDFIQTDATLLSNIEDNSIDSISSLHAIEHFGLGRYGDPIDPDAYFKAMKSIQRVVKTGGKLYFSVPIAMESAVYFNAHRVFSPIDIYETFESMLLIEFTYIHDYKIYTYEGDEARKLIVEKKYNIGNYDCGIFIFVKQ